MDKKQKAASRISVKCKLLEWSLRARGTKGWESKACLFYVVSEATLLSNIGKNIKGEGVKFIS